MKKILTLLALLLVTLPACARAATEELVITTKAGKEQTLMVEVVKGEEERAHGLMGRRSLPERAGMFFIFDTVQTSAFWMKNTLIPLDMIFINEKGIITKIHPMAQPQSRAIIKSGGPVRAGLEINGGMAAKLGIKTGDVVHHTLFGNELAGR